MEYKSTTVLDLSLFKDNDRLMRIRSFETLVVGMIT